MTIHEIYSNDEQFGAGSGFRVFDSDGNEIAFGDIDAIPNDVYFGRTVIDYTFDAKADLATVRVF